MEQIIAIFDVPGMTASQYENVMKDLDRQGYSTPNGRSAHYAAAQPNGWLVIDVWESGDKLEQFAGILMPVLAKNGVTPPQPKVSPIHNQVIALAIA
jgi:hypothetical protein